MKQPAAHVIEQSIVEQKNEISRDFLDTLLDQLSERPDALHGVFRREVQLAAGLTTQPSTAADAPAELVRGARVAALLFVHASHRNARTFIALDDTLEVDLKGEVNAAAVHAPAWLEAMWCALACGDELAQQWLATVSPKELGVTDGVAHARYFGPAGEFLRSLVTRDGRHGEWLAEAIAACGDEGDATLMETREHADQLELPALRAAFHLLAGEAAGFAESMLELHQGHRQHWGSAENRLAVDGLVSLRGCALLRLAAASGVEPPFASAYMPPAVWQAPARPHPVRCPYCLVPLSTNAPACGPCGREIRDAALELPKLAGPFKPCRSCRYPLRSMAVTCAQCRTRVEA